MPNDDRVCCVIGCERPAMYGVGRLYFCIRHADQAEDARRRQSARADDRRQRELYDSERGNK